MKTARLKNKKHFKIQSLERRTKAVRKTDPKEAAEFSWR